MQLLGYCSNNGTLSQKAQPTSAAIERLFSKLGKLLRRDRTVYRKMFQHLCGCIARNDCVKFQTFFNVFLYVHIFCSLGTSSQLLLLI